MPAYIKMRKAIEAQLQQKRKELVEIVTARYNAVFDELEKYAEEMHVSRDKFARRDTTISLNTGTNNFMPCRPMPTRPLSTRNRCTASMPPFLQNPIRLRHRLTMGAARYTMTADSQHLHSPGRVCGRLSV